MDSESMAIPVLETVERAELTVNRSAAYKFIKRAFDVIASVVGLVLCVPIFLAVGIAIKAEDPDGPVFYHHQRIGFQGREFTFYKLRSMYTNADAVKASLMDKNEMTRGSRRWGVTSGRRASTSCRSCGMSSRGT